MLHSGRQFGILRNYHNNIIYSRFEIMETPLNSQSLSCCEQYFVHSDFVWVFYVFVYIITKY